jgi:hypothetical protein
MSFQEKKCEQGPGLPPAEPNGYTVTADRRLPQELYIQRHPPSIG